LVLPYIYYHLHMFFYLLLYVVLLVYDCI
jgi:hypothetical protein